MVQFLPKISDFGLAKDLTREWGCANLQQARRLLERLIGEDPANRILLTGRMYVRFASFPSGGADRDGFERCFEDLPEDSELSEGIYTLAGEYARDPLAAWKELAWNAQIEEIAPIAAAILPSREPAQPARGPIARR